MLATAKAVDIAVYIQTKSAAPDLAFSADLAARTAVVSFLILAVWLVLIRSRPVGKARGLQPRLSALLGAFLVMAVVLFPRHELSVGMNLLSVALIAIGHLLAIYALLHLGRSFSIMAEARRLVTDGPYSVVRHPLYLAEEIAIIGVFLQFMSLETALLFVVHFGFQLQRMRNEERVLSQAFPEYAAYAARTRRFIPGVY